MLIRVLLLIVVASLLTGCGSDEPVGLEGFETLTITVDGRELAVAIAETPGQRSQGLMGVTDLGGLDGMLFVFQVDGDGGFWMKNTLIPLDIVFFAFDGGFVDSLTMAPCTEDPCPSYRPGGTYRYALEAPAGDLAFVTSTSRLELGD
jgi:uncharacterized membrane protein (UPF0127 family)